MTLLHTLPLRSLTSITLDNNTFFFFHHLRHIVRDRLKQIERNRAQREEEVERGKLNDRMESLTNEGKINASFAVGRKHSQVDH